VCTQAIVHTMNQEIESPKYPNRRAHRNYTPEFKVQLISVCKQDAASTAALALSHGMNANVLHRWLKEHERSGRHCLAGQPPSNSPKLPAFIPLPLPGKGLPLNSHNGQDKQAQITIELRKGAISMVVSWPVHAAADLASWSTAVLT
jgi:transposase